jgi:hypothetical protein
MVMGMAKHDLITKDFALYVVHYFASMLTWSKEDILSEIDRTIKEAKPADAVPVRCKDCKHYHQYHVGKSNDLCEWGKCQLISMDVDMPENGFCSYGERRTDDG